MRDFQPDASQSRDVRVDRAILEYLEAVDAGHPPDRAEFLARHRELADDLKAYFADQEELCGLTSPLRAPEPSADSDPLPAAIGGYTPVSFIGAGGMGRVYEARDPSGRSVALKLIAPRFAGSPSAVQRFRQEGRLAAQIAHPRSVFVIKADEELGQPYIAMELMTGGTLKDLVQQNGPLEPADALRRIFDVIDGLEQAHALGVIHRDVKPSNCYLDGEGRVKVGDFGLARSLAAGAAMTQLGAFLGTPLFASPEQLKGERLDERADVYSVAATLYYLLAGRAPFGDSEGAVVIARIASEDPPSPREFRGNIPRGLEKVLLKGLERSKARRFASLADFRDALEPFVPRPLTIAGLGLRFGAVCLDAVPFWIAAALAEIRAQQAGVHMRLDQLLALQMPFFVYFWLFEGTLGATPGKWLLGLSVRLARNDIERPGLWRSLVRTAIFVATGGALADVFVTALVAPSDRTRWVILSQVSYAVSLALRFSTMRPSNGYRGLHEFVSGTRVVQGPSLPGRHLLELPGRDIVFSGSHRDGLPARLGGFMILGAVRWDDAERVLVGEDSSLDRRAWLRIRSEQEEPIPAVRHEISRPTRLRWLGSSMHGPWLWDAFVAPSGRPLTECIAGATLGWGTTRLILEQLTEELVASSEEGSLPQGLSVNQVWIRDTGAVELLDIAPIAADEHETGSGRSPDDQTLTLLHKVAALALTARVPGARDSADGIRTRVPLHARRLLDRLADGRAGFTRLSDWRTDLAAIHQRPTECTRAHRAVQVGLSAIFLVIVGSVLVPWSRIGAAAAIVAIDRNIVATGALVDVLDNERLSSELYAALPRASLFRRDPAEARRLLTRRYSRDREELAARIQTLGLMRSMSVFRQFLDPSRHATIERGEGPNFWIKTRYPLEPIPLDLELHPWTAMMLLRRAQESDANDLMRVRLFAWTMICLPLLAWVLIAFVARGGITLRLAGVGLVRRDGREVSRLRAAGRALTVVAPFAAVAWFIVTIDLGPADRLWLSPLRYILPALLLILEASMAVCWPRRTVHDWLAGTYVVPR